jgi:ABC-2 type transport system ATP-binding protein
MDLMKALVIRNLKKTYDSGLVALKGINLEVDQGDFFALLGPNGAGKTTLIGIITSLVTKTAGEVYIDGFSIDTAVEKAKAQIGVVPQEFNFGIFEKVIDIVVNQAGFYGIPPKKAREKAEYYLVQLGIWDKRDQPARLLSGGMKRRLMIARALVHEPKILILDEPTAGVDIEVRRSMWAFLQKINAQGTTIILTTHYLEEAESLCKKVAIIHQGNMVENTTVKQLLSRLNTETFILDLKYPLAEKPEIPGCIIVSLDEKTIEISFEKTVNLNDLFSALSERHIEVMSMRNKTNRLEELFLRLVTTEA